MTRMVGAGLLILATLAASGCSLRTLAIKTVANTLSRSGDTFSRDEDPELVRDAVPFALKTYESLLDSIPNHKGLLLATCSGFTQYAYTFVQTDADLVESEDYERALQLRERALKLYLRGRGYCLRLLELKHRGVEQQAARAIRLTPWRGRRKTTSRRCIGRGPAGARRLPSGSTGRISCQTCRR